MKKRKQKWTAKEYAKLWGLLVIICVALCLIMLLFFFTSREAGMVFRQGDKRTTQDTSGTLPMHLYMLVFFGFAAVVNLLLLVGTRLYIRFHKPKGSTVVLKRRRR